MATGFALFLPSDLGTMDAPPMRPGNVLRDAAGNDVAVVVGTPQSNGAEPWNIFGERKWIAVGLAQIRTRKMIGWHGVHIPGADETITFLNNKLGSSNIAADGTGNFVSRYTTEAHMDAAIPNDANQDSRRKTDILLQGGHPASYPPDAATYCRSIVPLINGVPTPMDLPRLSVVMRIYQARDLIDTIDPTLAANPGNGLQQSTWGCYEGDNSAYVISSSVYGPGSTSYEWSFRNDGGSNGLNRSSSLGVIPALEIPAE